MGSLPLAIYFLLPLGDLWPSYLLTLSIEKREGFPGGFPGVSDGKESTCNEGDLGSVSELGRSPGGAHGNPLQYSYLENPHGQRSLAGYSPWGHKELDTTERLSTAQKRERETKAEDK